MDDDGVDKDDDEEDDKDDEDDCRWMSWHSVGGPRDSAPRPQGRPTHLAEDHVFAVQMRRVGLVAPIGRR